MSKGGTYAAKVVNLVLESSPFGVFVELGARDDVDEAQRPGPPKRVLVRASTSPVVSALRIGESVRVLVTSVDDTGRITGVLARCTEGKALARAPAGSAAAASKRPLLVLDLNGVLCDRGSFRDRNDRNGKGAPKRCALRPHALDFVSWCFEHFDVGVWSCGKRDNMELWLFDGRQVAFVWDQTHSTSLWPRTSHVSTEKPLFLKEIAKVWEQTFVQAAPKASRNQTGASSDNWRRGPPAPAPAPAAPEADAAVRYDATTTLLLDNHLEKFERNPVGSCVLVSSWTAAAADDDALAPGGALRRALEAAADAPDVGAFARANAETPDFAGVFPRAHPTPPADTKTGAEKTDAPSPSTSQTTAPAPPAPRPTTLAAPTLSADAPAFELYVPARAAAAAAAAAPATPATPATPAHSGPPPAPAHMRRKPAGDSAAPLDSRKKHDAPAATSSSKASPGDVRASGDVRKASGDVRASGNVRAASAKAASKTSPGDARATSGDVRVFKTSPGDVRPAPSARGKKSVSERFIEAYCSSDVHRRICPDWTPQKYLERRDSPGPRARPLRRRDMEVLRKERYLATEKTDGLRAWLYAVGDEAWLLNRDLGVLETLTAAAARSLTLGLGGATILDGEVVAGAAAKQGTRYFIAFDCVAVAGSSDVGAMQDGGAAARLLAAASVFERATALPFVLAPKTYAETTDGVEALFARMTRRGTTMLYDDGSRVTPCDGVVLTPHHDAYGYYASTCFKFKPVDDITLDVSVQLRALRGATVDGHFDLEASLADGGRNVSVTSVFLSAALAEKAPRRDEAVAEAAYRGGVWRVVRWRPDKRKANSLRAGWSVLECVADALSAADVVEAFRQRAGVRAVAAHYDAAQQRRNAGAQNGDMAKLRRLNNFVKALLINDLDADAAPVDEAWRSVSRPAVLPCPAALRLPCAAGKGPRRDREKRAPKAKRAVLELACGRGGDVGKWHRSYAVSTLVGVDASAEALEEAAKRARQARHADRYVQADFGDAALKDTIRALGSPCDQGGWVDLAGCFFALHYACGSRGRLEALFATADDALKPKRARFVVTVVDWRALRDVLVAAQADASSDTSVTAKIGGGALCRVVAPAATVSALSGLGGGDAGEAAFGLRYLFTLGDAVQNCEEFAVHIPSLVAVAAANGFRCKSAAAFGQIVADAQSADADAFAALAADVGVRPKDARDALLSDEDFIISQLYTGLVFERA